MTRPKPRRINVAVTPETVLALERIIEREGVTLTEAARRLMGYGDFVYGAVEEDGAELLLLRSDGTQQAVKLP